MHQRATYGSLVKDTILEPKDKIALPDRQASILRRMQQLTRYDESEFLDLDKDNENILKERAQQVQVQKVVADDPSGSIAEKTSQRQDRYFVQSSSGHPPDVPPDGGAIFTLKLASRSVNRQSPYQAWKFHRAFKRTSTTITTKRRTKDSGSNSGSTNITNNIAGYL